MLLAKNGIDFDYGDEEMLGRLASLSGNIINVGKMSYKRVLVSGMLDIRSSTCKLLEEFIKNGGRVIVAGEKTKYMDEKPFVFDLDCEYIECEEIPVYAKNGKEIITDSENIYSQTRVDGDERYVVLLNIDRENSCKVRINLGKGEFLEELNARDGSISAAEFTLENGDMIVNTTFAKGEEKAYCIKKAGDERLSEKAEPEALSLPQEAVYTLNEPNVLVLDKVIYKGVEYEILKADRKIRDEFNLPYRGGAMLQPWFVGENKKIVGEVEISYPFNIKIMPKKDVELVLEHYEDFEVSINGERLYLDKSSGKWVDICFDKFILPQKMLRTGENYITLKTKYHQTNDLEAIYFRRFRS